jgi:hypothetical protein
MNLIFVGKFLAKCKSMGKASAVALASLAESLLSLRPVLIDDVKRLKEAGFKSIETKSRIDEAKARKEETEAVSAANKLTDVEYEKAKQALELQEKAIRNRKLEADAAAAEAKADKAKADAAKAKAATLKSMVEVYDEVKKRNIKMAEEELFAALSGYNREGGKAYIDPENLKSLLKLKEKTEEPPEQGSQKG